MAAQSQLRFWFNKKNNKIQKSHYLFKRAFPNSTGMRSGYVKDGSIGSQNNSQGYKKEYCCYNDT